MSSTKKTKGYKRLKKLQGIRNPDCEDCSLHANCQTVCLIGHGAVKTDIMIVGEAPGKTEDEGGKPFQGRAGKLLDTVLEEQGISRKKCYVTNAVKCRPEGNATPSKTHIKACKQYLIQEIELVKPKIILSLGNTGLVALTNRSGIMKKRGEPQEITVGNHTCTLLPTIHPAMVMRNPKNRVLLENDIENLHHLVTGKEVDNNSDTNFEVKFVMNKADLKECLTTLTRSFKKGNYISYDLETEGFDFKNGRIWLMGISDRDDRSWIIPLEHPESPFRNTAQKVVEKFDKILGTPSWWTIAQNGKFDNKFLRRRGLKPYQNFDTLLAQHIVDENVPKSLDFLATLYFKAPNWGKGNINFTYEYNKKGVCTKEPSSLKKMGTYCGGDVIWTRRLYKVLATKLASDFRSALIFKYVTMPGSRMLERTEYHGLWVDRIRLGKRYTETKHKIEQALNKLDALVPDDFWEHQEKEKPKKQERKLNWNSPDQVGRFFFAPKRKKGLGLRIVERTASGNPSTSESVMIELQDDHEACQLLLEYRGWAKYMSTYIEPWLEMSDNEDHTLHPRFKLHGTVTGRLSSDNPNPQQTPRDPFIRANIGSPEGWTFIEGDYSQVELRVIAHMSGDPAMIRAYATGEDIHTKTASGVMQVPMSKVEKEQRKKAKAVNFGFVYGMSWRKFGKYAKDSYGVELTDDEAKAYRDRFFKLYKGLQPWHDRQRRIARKTKQVRAPHGRVRHLPDIDSEEEGIAAEAERQAINSPVQGFASGDLTLLSAILFDRIIEHLGYDDVIRVNLLVHDAVMVQVKNGHEEFAMKLLKGVMENPPLLEYFDLDFTVPLVADIQVGQYWGELEELDDLPYDREKVVQLIEEVMYYEEETST